ncbi:ABC transporter permease [Dictyobacter kobayashii]|uniref:ABC transporter permease n=1 Tax=Dictyobacter kobayashii TaxID=2014872 RepID=A0A402ABN7_9CHLR|nr:ABC-2 family transporter protein [Dictyobacter kobayashii]GCE16519.1 ABC transporter permease [Dictyobacter kobayashii]
MLRFYFEVARTAFRRQLIYRWANLAGLSANVFFAIIFSYVIIALYHASPTVAGYDVRDTLRYSWMMQAILMVVLPFGWNDLMQTIRTGDVVADLSKPCDFYFYWFSREMGRNVYYIFFRGIPTYVLGMLLFGLGLPLNWQAWLAYGLVLPFGAMLGVAYRILYNVVAFWIIEARAMITFAITIAQFLTGMYVPVPLLPAWLRAILNWLPFHGFMDLPVEVFLGKIAGGALWFEVARQFGWLIVLTMGVQLLTGIAKRRVVAQGG